MRLRRSKVKRLAGDNPLLRRAYLAEHQRELDYFSRRLAERPDEFDGSYRTWLIARGINPDTGKMSDTGIAFFKSLLDEDRSGRVQKRSAA